MLSADYMLEEALTLVDLRLEILKLRPTFNFLGCYTLLSIIVAKIFFYTTKS